jgi:hypothetical protein
MSHCAGGLRACLFEQGGDALDLRHDVPFDNKYDVLAAIVDWIKHDMPPDIIMGKSSQMIRLLWE